jgi:hypothetical protein
MPTQPNPTQPNPIQPNPLPILNLNSNPQCYQMPQCHRQLGGVVGYEKYPGGDIFQGPAEWLWAIKVQCGCGALGSKL